MSTIRDLPTAWRQDFLPAQFRSALFYVEAKSRENGRRVVTHEFPKKELPYAEDMGRRAIEFTVRGYCIQYPNDDANDGLHTRDYRIPRDRLTAALELEGDGLLRLPFLSPMRVAVTRYRLTEEDRLGGYCTFDMTFIEFGAPSPTITSSVDSLIQAGVNVSNAVQDQMSHSNPAAPR